MVVIVVVINNNINNFPSANAIKRCNILYTKDVFSEEEQQDSDMFSKEELMFFSSCFLGG